MRYILKLKNLKLLHWVIKLNLQWNNSSILAKKGHKQKTHNLKKISVFLSQHGRPSLKTKKNLTWNGQKNYSPIDIFDWSTSSSFGWRSVWRMKCLQRIKIQGSFERYTRHFFKKIILNKWRKTLKRTMNWLREATATTVWCCVLCWLVCSCCSRKKQDRKFIFESGSYYFIV